MTAPDVSRRIRGLYAITPDEPDSDRLAALVEASILGGATLLQYRNKKADAALRRRQAHLLRALCARHQVPLIINDDPELCLEVDAAGAHIGADDGNLAAARALLGTSRLLGVSCYDQLPLALAAQQLGADYVAFGACFASATKPAARRAPLDIFSTAADELRLPRVAIGGITPANAAQVIEAGADAIAVIGALFDSPDVTASARQFSLLFQSDKSS